jgi:tetratricopeptide (TPR) repeat protein
VLAGAVVLTWMQHATARQCDVWRSALFLWSHAVEVQPQSAIAHANYADALAETGHLEESMAFYRRSLDLRSHDPITTHHFADVLRLVGDVDGAIAMYLRTLQLDAGRPEAHYRLADLLIAQGRSAEAEAVLRERLRRVPGDVRAAATLAALAETGE